ncbi:hypothetical protein Tco_0296488 [Tanacetum coccineum]
MSVRGSVPPLPVTTLKGVGKHPRVLARYIKALASGSDSLAPDVKEAHAAHNIIFGLHYSLLKDKLGFLTFDQLVDVYDIHALQMAVMVAASSEESRTKLVEEVDGLQSRLKETERLGQQCQDLEHERDFLSQALDEVHGLGDSWNLKDVQDYHPEAEKIFDEVAKGFYKLEFPYISFLVENVGLSSEELASREAP